MVKNNNKFELPENLPSIKKEDFEFVNRDTTKKIHDEKLKTKPTTFAKDALKRFAKNKSSVVAACIIGVLLLASFITPFVSPYATLPEGLANVQTLLEPKLFDSGTGWWDGCKTYSNQPWNRLTNLPAGGPDSQGFKDNCIKSKKFHDPDTLTTYSPYAYDGNLFLKSKKEFVKGYDPEIYKLYTYNRGSTFSINKEENTSVTIKLNHTQNDQLGLVCDEYRVAVGIPDGSMKLKETICDLTDGWENYEKFSGNGYTLNISQLLSTKAGIDALDNAYLVIQGKPKEVTKGSEIYSYILIKSVDFVTESEDPALKLKLEQISFKDRTAEEINKAKAYGVTLSDANAVAGYGPDSQMRFPVGYWASNCVVDSYGATLQLVDIRYDLYAHVFLERKLVIGQSLMQKYLDNQWCDITGYPKDPATNSINLSMFNEVNPLILDNDHQYIVLNEDKCPVESIIGQPNYDKVSKIYQFDTVTVYYKYFGLGSVPRYVFGTDSAGKDMLTLSLSCLKNSLLVAIIATAICLVIGLIWGSISGYFGGTVDLVMERVTDIISGIPWIVMMTLCILLLGQNIVTFGIALVLTGWIGTSSTTRTQFYRFRDREYVLASRTLGASDARLIFKHILPNGLGTIVTSSVLMIPGCIFSEATISYLGLGLKTSDSFGVLLSSNQKFLSSYPMLIIWPAIIISLLMISFNLFGNGLRDALNPTLKGGEQ